MKSSKYTAIFLTLSFGLMMWLGWTPKPFFFLLFIGFSPLLFLERQFSSPVRKTGKFILFSYIALVIWNASTTWWMCKASLVGGTFTILCNSAFMLVPLLFYHSIKRRFGQTIGYLGLIVGWLSFEYLHHRWDFAWPWLSLGNGMADYPALLQWYEFTGNPGGSLWILVLNILFFDTIAYSRSKAKTLSKPLIAFLLILIIPVIISVVIFETYKEKGRPVQVAVMQPNIDPWNEKFDLPVDVQLDSFLKLSDSVVDSSTDYLVWPETALPGGIWLNDLENIPQIKRLRQYVSKYPKLKLITGIDAYKQYNDEAHATVTAHYDKRQDIWFDAFNTAIQVDNHGPIQIYHKSKLVPGAERFPYPGIFKKLEPLMVRLDKNEIVGSLATQPERTAMFNEDGTIGIATAICYESVFGEYITRYIHKGANLIFIMTNDGWWGNTSGHIQHMHYASLRAIETRKDIARSANTGTSCFIDQRGIIRQQQKWWTKAVAKSTLYVNDGTTFYIRFGDYIGRLAAIITGILFALLLIQKFKRKKHDLV